MNGLTEISPEEFQGETGGLVELTPEEFEGPQDLGVDPAAPLTEDGVWARYKQDIAKHGPGVLQNYGLPGATVFGASASVRAVGDLGMTGIMEGYDAIDEYLPEWVRSNIAEGATTFAEYMSEADKAVKSQLSDWGFDDVDQRIIGAAFDVATLGPGSTKNVLRHLPPKERGRVRRLAEKLKKSGTAKSIREKQEKLLKRVAPENPLEFDRDTMYREGGLPMRERYLDVGPDSTLQDQATAMSRINDLNPDRSYTHLTEKINDELTRSKKKVDTWVADNNKKIDMGELVDDLVESMDDLEANPWYKFLPGDAQKAAEDFMLTALDEMKGGKDLKSLLEARRKIDSLYRGIKSNLDPGNPRNGAEVAWRHVRNQLNGALRSKLPVGVGDDVYDMMQHQHHLLNAQQTLLPRIPQESVNAVYRSARYLRDHALLPSTALALAATAQFFAPVAPAALTIGAAGGSIAAAYKFGKSASGRKALGQIVRGLDEVMRITTDPKALKELRADRMVLLDLMRSEREEYVTQEEP